LASTVRTQSKGGAIKWKERKDKSTGRRFLLGGKLLCRREGEGGGGWGFAMLTLGME